MQTKSSVIPYRICILLSFLLWAMALPAQDNYIRTYAPGWEYSPGTILDTNNSMVSTSYYDAAGRLVQTVKHSFTPQRNDMANFIDYDELGRKIREWSYIPFNEANGSYKQREKFIESPDVGDHYVDYEYEPDAYHRITGEIGRNTSYKGVCKEYLFNTNTIAELSVWYFSPYSHYSDRLDRKGKYPDGSLACVKTTDEDGNVSYVFSDEQNRPVLERRMSDDGPSDTYYVYNDWDQLIAVLPPALIHGLSNSEQTQTYYTAQTNVFLEYAYLYKYDIQNHRIGVKLPGVDWHYTVYDGDHRPVLEQDGRQRLSNEWTFYKYDGLGRVILEGVFRGSTLDNMILTYADKLVKEEYTGNTSPTSFGYSENIIYPYPPTITKAYYYDTYDFLSLPMFESELDYQGWVTKPPRKWEYPGTSLQTGSYVSCLEEPGYELCTFYYDHRARNTRTDKYNNVSRLNTRIYQSYGFLDEIGQTHTYWKSQNEECYRRISNLYDHSNRLRTSFYYVTHEPSSKYFKAVLEGDMLNYEYDEFGRVHKKILIDKKDTIRYSYDSRSRLEQIKNRNFSERLYYDKVMVSGFSNSGPFNGQITGIQVRQGDNAYAYRLQYDKMTAYYFVTDHLGSVRTTAAAISGKVVQQLEYTPGGTIWRSFDQNALQPKHFCTKEQLTVHGYNMYDSGKRFHTSNGMRFISMDPLAEKYYSWSPYAYCFDNPMRIIDPDGKQPRPVRPPVRRGYRNGGRPNPYAFYPGSVKPQSYMQTTNLSYTGNGLRGTMAMEPQSFLLTVNTAGGNRVQMSKDKDNSIAHFATGVAEFTDAHIDFKNKLASLVSIAKYGENGVIQNSTELVINDPDLAIQQLSYEAQATEMNKNLGELDFTGKSLEEMVEMSAERKTIIQKKLGLSPKDLIMIELFTNPNAFQSTQQERRFLPEFNQR